MRTMNVCSECRRHVYEADPACPFCGSTAPRAVQVLPRAQRIARAAGYASAVLIAGLGSGCTESHAPEGDAGRESDAAVADAGTDGATLDAGADAAIADAGAEEDAEVTVPLYGGAFPDPRRRAVI